MNLITRIVFYFILIILIGFDFTLKYSLQR